MVLVFIIGFTIQNLTNKKGKIMKQYIAIFWRAPINDNEIGPTVEKVTFEDKNKTRAFRSARAFAKQKDWRFMSLHDESGQLKG